MHQTVKDLSIEREHSILLSVTRTLKFTKTVTASVSV